MSTIPVEETTNEIRVRVKDPGLFDKFRYITISASQGIRAVYGKYTGKDKWDIQAYRFAKANGWTKEKAAAWVRQHGGKPT